MKQTLKTALLATLPVLTGYLVLGFGFGLLMDAAGFGLWPALAMSACIYAGSLQYVGVGLLTGGASLLTVALTSLMVNARHLFYGVSMLSRYRSVGKSKPYLIFALTDETYSLVCGPLPELPPHQQNRYFLLVSLLNHLYWILGTALGAVIGTLFPFNSEGIEFALTALFLTVFWEQWLSTKSHGPALTGVLTALACLLIFGSEHFLIPAMLIIACVLCLVKDPNEGGVAP